MGMRDQTTKDGRRPAGKSGSGRWQAWAWRTIRIRFCLLMAFLLVVTVPAGAWTVPATSGDCTKRFGDDSSWYESQKQCQFAAQLEPDTVFVGGEKELGTGYYTHPHAYQIENAIRLFKEKGYDNWALYLSSPDRFQALTDGATWADAYKGRLIVHFSLHVLFVEVYGYDYNVCNYAGFDQYYNTYDTDPAGKGLDAEGIDILADSLPVLIKTLGPAIVELAGSIAGVPGLGGLLASVSADVRPSLQGEYPSGALQAQQHYDRAISYYYGGATDPATGKSLLYWPQRSEEYNSLFQLGWSTHFIQDIGVIYHLRDIMSSFPPNPHNDFEDDAQGHGDMNDGISQDYHVSASSWTLGLDYDIKKITELARDEAYAVNNANDWALARSQDAEIRRPAVQKGSRISEQFTAAVIAKYLAETGIPKVKQPFRGTVEDLQNRPVPYAYVFYRKGLQCVQNPDTPALCGTPPGAWNFVRADKNGVYVLDLRPSDASTLDTYLVRPVMPGYRYAGYQAGGSGELMGATLDGKPLEYKPPWKTEAVTTNPYYEFYLAPLEGGQPAPVPSMVYLQPVVLPFLPGDLLPSTADALKQDLITVNAESPILRVHTTDPFQQKMIALPETSYVEIQLANLVDLNTPRVMVSPETIRSTVVAAKNQKDAFYAVQKPGAVSAVPLSGSAALKAGDTAPIIFVPSSTTEGWHNALASLPKTRTKAPNGTMVEVPDLTFALGNTPSVSGEFLPAIGMARVPARNAQVELTLETGPGTIGPGFMDLYPGTAMAKLPGTLLPQEGPGMQAMTPAPATLPGCLDATGSGGCQGVAAALKSGGQQADPVKKSLVLTTDDNGRAALLLQTGNQAGRIRLHFRAVSNPDAPGVLPEDTVDFMVHPLFKEPDPISAVPPVIQAVRPREEEAPVPAPAAGPKKPPVLCFSIAKDRTATVVPCPDKPVTVKIMDFISSVTSAIGKIPEAVWPSQVLQSATGGYTACDDGNACTVMDRVVRGTCTGDPVICTPTGRCDPSSGCVYGPADVTRGPPPLTRYETAVTLPVLTRPLVTVPDEAVPVAGSPCDDGNACTTGDVVTDGACRGEPFLCNDGNDMTADSCDPRSGCVFTQLEQVPATTVMTEPQGRIIIPAPVSVPVTVTAVPEPCPAGCSCLTRDEAVARFGRFLPCSDRPCGSLESPEGPVPRYCLRPAA